MEYTASYLAEIPLAGNLQVIELSGEKWIYGKYSGRTMDLFEMYRKSWRASGELPYSAFANSGDDESSVLSFTQKWGVVAPEFYDFRGKGSFPLKTSRGSKGFRLVEESKTPWEKRMFGFKLNDWRRLHGHFKNLLSLKATTDAAAISKICAELQKNPDFGALTIGLGPVFATAVPRLTFQPSRAWEAFCLMFWLDLEKPNTRLMACPNPTCGQFFTTDRPNKKYCSVRCASLMAKRSYWAKAGSSKRRSKQKEASRLSGGKFHQSKVKGLPSS